jgi:hypothetical protein
MTKTAAKRSRFNISPSIEVFARPSGNSKTINIPTTPKAIEEPMNIRVAIFCMVSVYHLRVWKKNGPAMRRARWKTAVTKRQRAYLSP